MYAQVTREILEAEYMAHLALLRLLTHLTLSHQEVEASGGEAKKNSSLSIPFPNLRMSMGAERQR